MLVLATDTVQQLSNSSSTDNNFSSTITQEANVDEGDIVKYDGEFIYIAAKYYNNQVSDNDFAASTTPRTSVRVMQRGNDGDIIERPNITVNENASNIDNLYLGGDTLAVISNISHYNYDVINATPYGNVLASYQKFNLSVVDVQDPGNASIRQSYNIDGYVIDSRRVGDTLYIVSRFTPVIAKVNYPHNESERIANYHTIQEQNIDDLLPKYTDANGEEQNLVNVEDCYLPQNATRKDDHGDLVTLTAIDMSNTNDINLVCVNTEIIGIYATPASVYLHATDHQYNADETKHTSMIHKFSIDGQTVEYVASGALNGKFGWQSPNCVLANRESI